MTAFRSVLDDRRLRRFGKPLLHAALAAPLLWLCWQWWAAYHGMPNALGFNPQEASNRLTGDWALRVLIIAFAVSPLAKARPLKNLLLFRRMLGVWGFFYALIHMLSLLVMDLGLDVAQLWQEIVKRQFITVGMASLLLLLPLAVTSTSGWIKRLGAARWRRLHRLIYLAMPLAALHFIMMRKGWQPEPLIYAAGIAVLFLARWRMKKRRSRP